MLKALLLWLVLEAYAEAFSVQKYPRLPTSMIHSIIPPHVCPKDDSRSFQLAMIFGKLFEEKNGPLGKGITVGKVQVALSIQDRQSPFSIFKLIAQSTRNVGDSNRELSRMAHEVCVTLLRNSDKWVGACSSSQWFSQKDGGKAENLFNEWVNREATKFEKVLLDVTFILDCRHCASKNRYI